MLSVGLGLYINLHQKESAQYENGILVMAVSQLLNKTNCLLTK